MIMGLESPAGVVMLYRIVAPHRVLCGSVEQQQQYVRAC